MNIALIIAGGVGKRTQQKTPKQFITIDGKPILIYTLESFQVHSDIDAIELVCLDGWQNIIEEYIQQYEIFKLKWIVTGGNTAQESIRNGVFNLHNHCNENDIVIIHDGIRPLIDKDVVSDCIKVCNEYGNAVSSLPYNEQIFKTTDGFTSKEFIPRETLRRVQTPQAYKFGKLYQSYKRAFDEEIGIYGSSYTNTMMVELGESLHFAAGSDKNIKITTAEDIDIFRVLLKLKKCMD
jgi:2-C-methyl-D-erythritol 4-phosphate cytidylyltransferase